ncbi:MULTISPECIES: hotdog fold domain-containing protein [unclassified Pseudomonas]|uniref:hotdog fold domain-containing protein n=1 Tax=unclassified Pseudomonas TaxID=196821 RepID=UPI0004693C8E|nr:MULTISPECIES: hotdog fold domain-containing protein [unclassified Pseudomonas]MCE4052565.1 DUF4442 domain-containing protein [Pseudomonas sp. Au-Pse12]BFD41679.1 hotdog fold domain-containing protein [Pseudomonas sp. FFPRI_1]
MSQVLSMFNSAGAEKFTQMACQMAPYFATINPLIDELQPGHCQVRLPFRREITNHLGTVHAIALCNAAELAAGVMTDASIPAGARWIPKGMSVQYLAKAKGSVRTVADGSAVDWASAGDKVVAVTAFNEEDQAVFTAQITMNVKLA